MVGGFLVLNFTTEISIDNLSFTAKMATNTQSNTINEYLSNYGVHMENSYWYSPKNFMYQHNFKFGDGSFFQYGEFQNEHTCRLEFNPNKCDWKIIYNIIKRVKYPKLTRMDIAVDYKGIDLSEYKIDMLTARTQEFFFSRSGKLETQYIGSRSSDNFVRIYDKAKEQNKHMKKEEEEEIQIAYDWWRVEAVIKDFQHDKFGNIINEPFPLLIQERKENNPEQLKIAEKAMLFYLEHNPSEWEKLSPNSKRKYKNMSFSYEYRELEIQPYQVYEKEKQALFNQVNEWLAPAIANGNYLIGKIPNEYDTTDIEEIKDIKRPIGEGLERYVNRNWKEDIKKYMLEK